MLMGMTALVWLCACGGNAAPDQRAARAVEQYLTAKVARNTEAMRPLLCSAMERDFEAEALAFASITEATIDGMACAADADGLTVTCDGTIHATYGAEQTEFPLGTYRVVEEDGDYQWCGEVPSGS